jgi:hypothetical protein
MGTVEKHRQGRRISRLGTTELVVGQESGGRADVSSSFVESRPTSAPPHASVASTSGDTATPAGDGTSIGGDALDIRPGD